MVLRHFPTRPKLWAVFGLALFGAAGSVNWVPEADPKIFPYWSQWALLLTGEHRSTPSDFLTFLALWGIVFAIPSVVLGWIGQAAVGVVAVGVRGSGPAPTPKRLPVASGLIPGEPDLESQVFKG